MSRASVVSVAGLSKKYCHSTRRALWYAVRDMAAELDPRRHGEAALRSGEFWALDDVSFELAPGESLAIVGRNGAGKSTLLKVLYGLLKPDRGQVLLRGRVEALIELGTGISPVLTGRENIAVAAALHGLDRRTSGELREHVADFAELGEFLDAPVQTYSAGMKSRLSYAIAAHLRPDVLLVDEVLAVGDMDFQRKCAAHMRSYLENGGSLLLVSHNIWHIQSVCDRGLLLDRGRIVFAGDAREAVNAMFDQSPPPAAPRRRQGRGPVTIADVGGEPLGVRTNDALRIELRYSTTDRVTAYWGFSIWTPDGAVCVTSAHDLSPRVLEPGEGRLSCVVPRLPLVAGHYLLRATVTDAVTRLPLALYGWEDDGALLDVSVASTSWMETIERGVRQLVTVDVDWN